MSTAFPRSASRGRITPGRRPGLGSLIVALVVATGCATGTPPSSPAATAASFAEYRVAFCAAFDALFDAVGNPDTGTGSELSDALDEAVATGDAVRAAGLAAETTAILEEGRRQIAVASGWPSAATMLGALDRLFLAFEAMATAKAARAADPASSPDPQAAFEAAGGLDAWFGMLEAGALVERPTGAPVEPCPTVPVTP